MFQSHLVLEITNRSPTASRPNPPTPSLCSNLQSCHLRFPSYRITTQTPYVLPSVPQPDAHTRACASGHSRPSSAPYNPNVASQHPRKSEPYSEPSYAADEPCCTSAMIWRLENVVVHNDRFLLGFCRARHCDLPEASRWGRLCYSLLTYPQVSHRRTVYSMNYSDPKPTSI